MDATRPPGEERSARPNLRRARDGGHLFNGGFGLSFAGSVDIFRGNPALSSAGLPHPDGIQQRWLHNSERYSFNQQHSPFNLQRCAFNEQHSPFNAQWSPFNLQCCPFNLQRCAEPVQC